MIDLNIFTNCTQNFSSSSELITNTYRSFVSKFSLDYVNNVRIFVDPNPRVENLRKYVHQITTSIPNNGVHVVESLADGYIKSTEISTADYIFQLEHDWEFTDAITHSLVEVIKAMKFGNMEHLRFNKRKNVNMFLDKLEEQSVNGITFCKTPFRSNNPHIINRKAYLNKWNDVFDLNEKGSRGIENNLLSAGGYIYGGYNHPQQITHTDGRR